MKVKWGGREREREEDFLQGGQTRFGQEIQYNTTALMIWLRVGSFIGPLVLPCKGGWTESYSDLTDEG